MSTHMVCLGRRNILIPTYETIIEASKHSLARGLEELLIFKELLTKSVVRKHFSCLIRVVLKREFAVFDSLVVWVFFWQTETP